MLQRRRRRRRLRMGPIGHWSLNRMIPNILTLLALCAGMTAIRLALAGKFETAVAALVIAGIFDGIDGRIARLLQGMTSFGAELDSLSDFVSFGVAPAIMLYLWTMQEKQSLGWALVLLFAVCCALRLARFNTQIGAALPPFAYNFFTGVPAPAGAGLAIVPMLGWFEFGWDILRAPSLNGVWLAVVGGLMVSRIPTYSLKRFRVPHHWVLPMLLLVGLLAAFLTTEPWGTLLAVGLAYIVSIPISIRAYGRLKRANEARVAGHAGEQPLAADAKSSP